MLQRRVCQVILVGGGRWASSYANLVTAQKLLVDGKKIPANAAKDFAKFFNVAVPKGKSVETATKAYFDGVQRAVVEEEGGSAVREQSLQKKQQEDLPVFLLGYHFKSKSIVLYSVAADRVVAEFGAADDPWDLADAMMQHTGGNKQFIIVPVVEAAKDRRLLAPVVEAFAQGMVGSGLLPVWHVDSVELAETLERSPPSFAEVTGAGSARTAPAALSEKWFRAYWVFVRTLACKATDADPLHTVNTYIFPRFDVYVVHLVRAGSRNMNISIWDPVRKRRYVAKGMLSDVLACLFSTQAKRFILIPTNRTDRAILFRCRAALLKAGHRCVIVFASEVDDRYRRVFHSEPGQYWRALREASGALDVDLLTQVYRAAGSTFRAYHRKMLLEGKHKPLLDARRESTGGEDDDLAPMTEVEEWLKTLQLPKRRAAEEAEERHYRKYLAVAFASTEYLAFGQPRNPLAPQNYIVSASFIDSAGHVLEPWRKFSSRGQFAMPALDHYQVLVVHDMKHFLLLLGCDNEELRRFLKRGGRVWCTMLAEYLLEAQRSRTGSNTLSDVALKYGVLLPPATRVGAQADDLPLAFHRRHLLAAAPAVAAVFADQLRRAVAQCQLVSVAHRMDSLLAMAWMEWSGIRIDVHEANRQATALANAVAVMDKALAACVPPEVPLDMRDFFDWESPTQLHAYFFGGNITVGRGTHARSSRQWTSNLVHLCHRYGALPKMLGELHLQRFAAENGVSTTAGRGKLPARIGSHIDEEGSQKRKKYRLVVFDVETTGLNPTSDDMIEVAMYDPVENTSFTSLVKPQRRISPRTISIHHITDEAVRDAPPAETVVKGLIEYLRLDARQRDPDEVVILLGHNVFALDEPMLRRALLAHAPEVDHDGLLFCDSIVMLRALKAELQDSRLQHNKVDPVLLEALTSSLRLGKLIEKLHVTPEGELHRADTDTKALWFVLVNAFGLTGKKAVSQRDSLLAEAAKTLVLYPATGCFVPSERKSNAVTLQLPGIAREMLSSHGKFVSRLASRPFGEKVLESLYTHGVKVAGLVLQRLGLERHNSKFLQTGQNAALSVLHPDSAVHQHIDMTATTTSRTTSAYPSLQNIPKDDKSSVRRLFVSRFGARGRCVEIDYSQLEIVVLAILCRDKNLMRDLNSGVDFHVKRAEFFSGLPYKEIYEGHKREIPKYVKLRKTAKQFSFQRLYGAGVPLLHKTTGIPVKDLQASIRMEEKAYPGISHFHRISRSVALRPNNPGLPTGFIVEMPTGQRMSFRTRDVILNLPPLKNYPIQGYGAELAQMMLGRVFRHFAKRDFYGNKAAIINFVHDSVWLDCHVDVLEECVRDTQRILSSVHTYVPDHFPGVDICVPLRVSSTCCLDMCAMQSIDNDFSAVAKQKRTKAADLSAADLLPTPAAAAAALAAANSSAGDDLANGDDGADEMVAEADETEVGLEEAETRPPRRRTNASGRKPVAPPEVDTDDEGDEEESDSDSGSDSDIDNDGDGEEDEESEPEDDEDGGQDESPLDEDIIDVELV